MKKIALLIASFLMLTTLLVPKLALAQAANPSNPLQSACDKESTGGNTSSSAICKNNQATTTNPIVGPNGIITRAIQLISFAIGVGAVLVIIIAGLRLVISGGDPKNVSESKNAILYAVVGLVVALLAQTIVFFTISKI